MRSLSLTIPLAVLFAALAGACGLKGENLSLEGQAIAEDAIETDVTIGAATALSALPSFSLSGSQMTLSTAVAAQADVGKFAEPPGCLTTTVAGNVVTYHLDGCTGPWGKLKVSGQETATFSPGTAGGVGVDLASDGLTIEGLPVTHEAHVEVTFKSGVRRVTWLGNFEGTTLKGRHVKHASSLVLDADASQCLTLNGTTDTTVGLRGLSVKYEDLQRCGTRATCPTGAVAAVGRLTKLKVTLTFDGTDEMVATGARGEKTFPLDCAPVAQP
jgi:hypothetical protein